LAALVTLVAACDDAGAPAPPTPSATPAVTPNPTPTADSRPDLASLIAPRFDIPETDPFDLARRYRLTEGRAPATKPFAGEPQIGDRRDFFVQRFTTGNSAPPLMTTITAVLRAKSEHALFWVDASVPVTEEAAAEAARLFESITWPRVTEIFGLPPTPGLDSDPRVVILQSDLGGVGGYVSPDNLLPREVRPASNEAELINMDVSLPLGSAIFNAVLGHELQHLIHEQHDAGEESWVNEGLSETAQALTGSTPSSIGAFTVRPETQLNAWGFSGNLAHYGASASFLRYVADRFGGDPALGRMASQSGDGPLGIDQFLQAAGAGLDFASVFGDWLAANILDAAEGPYAHQTFDVPAQVNRSIVPGEIVERAAAQFGADYYRIDGVGGSGEYEVRFQGEAAVAILPPSAYEHGSEPFFWSNRGDEINTTLTRRVDLTGVTDPSLTFAMWHDIERWYDRGYVAVSTDDGDTWTALAGETTIAEDPVRLAYGPGYHGTSGNPLAPEWVQESVDLSPYAGQEILLRFEYVTDGGTHGEGWGVRDIRIGGLPRADLSLVDGGWKTDGWVLVDGSLAQRYIVRIIGEDSAGAPVVRDVALDTTNRGTARIDFGAVRNPVIAIAGATEGTHQPAPYRLEIREP